MLILGARPRFPYDSPTLRQGLPAGGSFACSDRSATRICREHVFGFPPARPAKQNTYITGACPAQPPTYTTIEIKPWQTSTPHQPTRISLQPKTRSPKLRPAAFSERVAITPLSQSNRQQKMRRCSMESQVGRAKVLLSRPMPHGPKTPIVSVSRVELEGALNTFDHLIWCNVAHR